MKREIGQYFTTSDILQQKLCDFIKNNPKKILEPSVGRGDLVKCLSKKFAEYLDEIDIDMYEIDNDIHFLPCIKKRYASLHLEDFLQADINEKYMTIIGNPPYVRHKKGNLYIDFTAKCFHLLEDNGELIFIVPSDFFKLTCASKLLTEMLSQGTFTHIFQPHNEKLFEGASIDVVLYRYCKTQKPNRKVLYNDEHKYIINNDGVVMFSDTPLDEDAIMLSDVFNIYVGMVSGKDDIFKNNDFGNIQVLNSNNQSDTFIYISSFPSSNQSLNTYLEKNKLRLMARKIRKFNEDNWFEWGAPRNMKIIAQNIGRDCIYVCTLTRNDHIAFIGKVQFFGGTLIMLLPKSDIDLYQVVEFLNSVEFKNNFVSSGRFKIGHRQLAKYRFCKENMRL